MASKKYAIMQGNGSMNREIPATRYNPDAYRKHPYLVAQGPSGQLAILPPFSGTGTGTEFGDTIDPHADRAERTYHSYMSICSHKPIAWRRNKIHQMWRTTLDSSNSPASLVWHPYKNAYFHRNASCGSFDTNSTYNKHIIHDVDHGGAFYPRSPNIGGYQYIAHQDGIYGVHMESEDGAYIYVNTSYYASGVTEPTNFDEVNNCLQPRLGGFGNPGDSEDGRFVFPGDDSAASSQAAVFYATSDTSDPNDETLTPCDIVEHEGAFYFCSQNRVWSTRIGQKGCFIYSDFWDMRQDEIGDAVNGLALIDPDRGTKSLYDGPQARVFAKHRGNLYMLQADGKILEVFPGGLVLREDLKNDAALKSPWASGIRGGSLQRTPITSAVQFPQPRVARPFMISFNDELHAFLNYDITSATLELQTGFPIAKGNEDGTSNARGLCWFTSHDGFNWHDRTSRLGLVPTMASGIITPSGNKQLVVDWQQITSPYIFSAFQNTNYPSGYGARTGVSDENSKFLSSEASQQTGDRAPETRGSYEQTVLEPSGYRQATGRATETLAAGNRFGDLPGRDLERLPLWTSGNLIDNTGTAFDQLQIKLGKGSISGFMYPTLVDYPSGFDYINPTAVNGTNKPGVTDLLPASSGGVWSAWGQGARGWDYTGVGWRHTTGFVDDTDSETNNHRLRLCFSRNPFGSTDNATKQTASHFWELDTASGWHQVNYVHWGGCMIGYHGVDIHDPEVIIPSGSVDDPNPFVDHLRDHVRVKFQVLDFGFWDNVNMKLEYTTDEGISWHAATVSGSLGPLATNNKEADPSGLFGQEHEVFWRYKQDLGSKIFPLARIRMRAEVPF